MTIYPRLFEHHSWKCWQLVINSLIGSTYSWSYKNWKSLRSNQMQSCLIDGSSVAVFFSVLRSHEAARHSVTIKCVNLPLGTTTFCTFQDASLTRHRAREAWSAYFLYEIYYLLACLFLVYSVLPLPCTESWLRRSWLQTIFPVCLCAWWASCKIIWILALQLN